jgi:hypothetical protein
MDTVKTMLEQMEVGEGIDVGPLTLFPLLSENDGDEKDETDYLLLDEAIESKQIEITEVDKSGSVPELKVINSGDIPVLMIEGEQLIGAKQNRTLNSSIFVGANSEVIIPVSCTEAGRWSSVSSRFRASRHHSHPRLRRMKAKSVRENMERGMGRRSNQRAVWDEVDRVSARLQTSHPTRDYEAAHDEAEKRMDEEIQKIELPENAIGVVVTVGNQIEVMDAFGNPDTLRKLLPKLMSGYWLAGMVDEERIGETEEAIDLSALLSKIDSVDGAEFPTPGNGEEVKLVGPKMEGMALTCGDQILHMAVFPEV